MNGTTTVKQTVKVNPYLVQKVMSASQNQLTSYIYDVAIAACGKKDSIKAGKAVRELMNSLNFEHKEIALTFFNVYRYINSCIVKGKFDESKQMLTDIKNTWDTSMKLS